MSGIYRFIKHIRHTYFSTALDLRVRLFNVLVLASTAFCIVIGIVNLAAGLHIVSVIVDFAAAAFCWAMLVLATKSGRMVLCYLISIVISFFVLFPYLFFNMGGYHGGIPAFLVFAVVFTMFMLEGKTAWLVTVLELLLYAGMYIFAFNYPDTVKTFPTEKNYLISNLMDLIVVGLALGATMFAQVRIYQQQQKKLGKQNTILAETNRAKTEFLANVSHEMRTPLTVISVSVQTVTKMLESMGAATQEPETKKILVNTQSEIMRLSRMVSGMLDLASMSGSVDKTAVDLSSLLHSSAEMLRLSLDKRGNILQTDVKDELKIFGNADLFAQVITNLLTNANTYTENGTITLSAKREGSEIIVAVNNTGYCIAPELLPHVFERGTTTGGTGIGLYLCKTIVESHGGSIWIESEPIKCTTVYFTLPVYGGQFEGVKQ